MNIPWYLSRSTGMVAYLLLFATVVLGISIRTKAMDRVFARWRVTDLHLFLTVLMLLFVAVHALVLLADGFVGFSVAQVLVPFTASYRPFWTGLGVIGAYLLLVIALSFAVRQRIGYRTWRGLHYATFAAYVAALVHGVYSGTDTSYAWADVIYIATALAVVGLVLYRIANWSRYAQAQVDARAHAATGGPWKRRIGKGLADAPAREAAVQRESIRGRAQLWGFSSVAVAIVVLFAALLGPFGWAGGPASTSAAPEAVAGAAAPGASAPAGAAASPGNQPGPAPASAANPRDFSEQFAGTLAQHQNGDGTGELQMEMDGQGQPAVKLVIDLQLAVQGRRQSVVSNTASLTDSTGAALCNGQVTQLENSGFSIDCQGAGTYSGQSVSIDGTFDSVTDDRVSGSFSVQVGP